VTPLRAPLNVPLVQPVLGEDEISAVVRVLRSGQLAQGPEVAAFEAEFAALLGVRHAVAVNSGTAAVHCALAALEIGEDDEVVTTPFTFAATATPILMQRARVRFVDIDPRTFNADVAQLARAVTPRTKAVLGVDLFGLPFDREGSQTLRSRGVAVVEDACQAIGAARDGVPAGAGCDAAAFSFYATKNLTTGEGGMLATDDDSVAAAARRFRQHGQGERYEYLSLGYNYRLTDILAAIGRTQLARLPAVTAARRANAAFYDAELAGIPGIATPFVPAGVEHAYHQYSILVDETRTANGADRDGVRAALAAAGVGSGVYYPTPLHRNALFARDYAAGDFPVAEATARRILALPIHPALTGEMRAHVVAAVRDAVGIERGPRR
jgi:perosamine synthetase